MKRVVSLVTLPILLAGLVLLRLSDTVISIADISIPDNGVAGSGSQANNSPATATITVTMYAVAEE